MVRPSTLCGSYFYETLAALTPPKDSLSGRSSRTAYSIFFMREVVKNSVFVYAPENQIDGKNLV
jgi:hypothetical protein